MVVVRHPRTIVILTVVVVVRWQRGRGRGGRGGCCGGGGGLSLWCLVVVMVGCRCSGWFCGCVWS